MKINKEDKEYPSKLKQIRNKPKQIYCKGNIELLEKPSIAIIGSRTCTSYGEKMAIEFAKGLSKYGITIISGMAKGIDSFAHKGALEVGGKTIAVLPSGLKNIYPKENEELFNEILKNDGLVITEYEDYMEADSKKFLKRNRIVSALSIGILVVEGGKISGTSVTARIAEKQGKKVFCIPSSLENPKGIVPNKLIKEGAKLVTEVKDILNEYEELGFNEVRLKEICTKERITKKKISEEYIDIYNLLEENGCMNIDEITRQLNANSKDISYKLMMMELENNIVSLPGKNFKIK